jgi:dTDP-4-amino-4,6-dideoxygalactose transaminase
MKPYDNVKALEGVVSEYAGSKYAVAVDSCTNALLLSFSYAGASGQIVYLPKYTYVGVAQAVLNAGGICQFHEQDWQGAYHIGIREQIIVDSARRFRQGMYEPGTLYCLSCHWSKHLKIGRGGFILTDDEKAYEALKRMRFDGRAEGVPPASDKFIRGYHCYMLPEEAARGLMLMSSMPDNNEDIPWDGYGDLSKHLFFQGV